MQSSPRSGTPPSTMFTDCASGRTDGCTDRDGSVNQFARPAPGARRERWHRPCCPRSVMAPASAQSLVLHVGAKLTTATRFGADQQKGVAVRVIRHGPVMLAA